MMKYFFDEEDIHAIQAADERIEIRVWKEDHGPWSHSRKPLWREPFICSRGKLKALIYISDDNNNPLKHF